MESGIFDHKLFEQLLDEEAQELNQDGSHATPLFGVVRTGDGKACKGFFFPLSPEGEEELGDILRRWAGEGEDKSWEEEEELIGSTEDSENFGPWREAAALHRSRCEL